MPAPKVPDSFFNHLLELRDLEMRGQSPEGQAAAQAELSNLDLYQVAANASEERDPAAMGEIEQLLRRGDFPALQARLGSGLATEVRDRYLDAFRQVEAQKGIQRTGGEMITDAAVGTPASFVNMLWTGEMLAGGVALGPEYMATSAERNVEFNREIVDPLLSDALKARRMVAGAVDAADQREHALEAQRELAAGGDPLSVTAKRLAKDFGSGIANTVEDPTLLAQGLVEAGASMGTTALLSKGFAKVGQAVVARQAARITNQAIARGTAKEIAEKIGERVTRQMASNANKLAWAAAAGTAEGTGAYQQTVLDILSMSTDELAKSSEDFRALVEDGMSPVEAQRTIAHRAGLLSAGLTGVMGAGLGHLLGQGGASPTKIVQSFTKDVLEEGIEEGLQGMSGQLAGNFAQQVFADPNKDVLEGVGFTGGQGAILGLGSAGVMKTPGLASTREAQIAAQGVRTAAEAVGTLGATVADKRLAAEEAKSSASVQALVEQIGSLNESGKAGRILEAANALKPTGEEAAKINAAMNSLVNSHYVNELPASVNELKPENKALFEKDQDLADAADKAARALLKEKDEGEQVNLALTLNGLLEPLRQDLGNSPELARVKENEQAAEVINEYSEVLANIGNLPSVKRALSRVDQILNKQAENAVQLTDENINTPEGQKTVQIEAARAVLSPGTGNAENIERILLHSEGDGLNLTPSQRIALKGSQALIQAREQIEQARLKDAAMKAAQTSGKAVKITDELVKRHLTPQQRTGSQVTVGMDPAYLEEGKYSAKQHTDRIIKAMMAGDTETAQEYLQDAALFAEHMGNKVIALNTHFEAGDPKGPQVAYPQLTPERDWVMSDKNPNEYTYKGEFVNTINPSSIEHAQEVAAEAEMLHSIVTNLSKAFPELQVKVPALVKLNPALRGDAKVISKKIRTNWAKQQQATASNQEAKKAPAPAKQEVKQETPKPKTVKPEPVAAKKAEKKPEPKVETKAKTETKSEPKIEKKEEPKVEEPVEAAPVVEETVAEEAAPKAPKTVAELFSSLVQKGTNYFHEVFKLRKVGDKLATRTLLVESPLETARQAMDGKGFKELTGKDNARLTDEIAEHYEGLVRVVGAKLVDALNGQLKAALGAHLKNAFDGTKEPHRYVNGKLLNIVEHSEDGTYRFNRNLQESAVLAGLQWWISASQRQTPVKDDEDVADQHELDVEDISPEDLQRLQAGQSLPEAKRSLATFVRRFWGVSGDPEGLTGYTEGIPEAMAAEMLDAFEAAGLLHIDTVEVQGKTIDRYHLEDLEVSEGVLSPVYAYPSAIEDAVVVDAEPTSFFEDDKVPLSTRQMSNPNVETTEEQNIARENMQAEKFYLNMPMVNWILGLGEEGTIKAFGTVLPEDAEKTYNKGHLASLRGKNTSILGAFKELQRVKMEMENEAKAHNVPVESLGKKYAYAVSSVNRIVMQGAHNPQASKLMREAVMSTWSTLDLSDESGAHWQYFMLATAQALGIKVHRQSFEANIAEADAKLKALKPAIDVLASNGPLDEYLAALKAAGVENSFLLTYTLQEHARLRTADKKSFRTALYLEADGMTNGPFNAMGLLTVGEFTAEWIENVKKGGVSFGQTARTADTLAAHKRDDLYQAGVNRAQEKLSERLSEIEDQPQGDRVGGVARMLHEAMAILLPDDVSIREDGTLELQRGIGKNPMTVLIYGSGVRGIANKLTHNLTKKFYEKLTEAAQSGKPLDPKLRNAMNVIAGVEVAYGKTSGEYYIQKGSLEPGQQGPLTRLNAKNGLQSFEFDKTELARIQANFQYLFVESMRDGIQDVLGKAVFDSGALLRKATQVQSIVARDLFMKAIMEAVEAKKKADPNYKADSEFLSRKELEDIWDRLLPTMPMVHVDNQAFLVAKNKILEFFSESVDKKTGKKTKRTLYEFSRSLAGHRRTPAYVMAVENAGVSAIPYLTIGMGDARMVRKIFQEAFERSMQVYDGINIPVDKIPEYGKRINEAALYAWQGNIFQGVGRAFDKFLGDPRVADALATNPELVKELAKQLDVDEKLLADELNVIATELDYSALSMQARRIALNGVAISMDQMAGTFAPFVSQGMDIDADASPADVKDLLNERYQEALKTLQTGRPLTSRKPFAIKKMDEKPAPAPAPAKVEKPRPVPTVVPNMGRKSATGVRILRKTAIKNMPKVLGGKLTKGEAELLGEITRSGALDDHEIIIGDKVAISRYIQEQGRTNYPTPKPGQQIHGFYSPSDRALYVISEEASVETLLHEMVHAATLSTVDAYYAGKLEGDAHKEVREAVERLEKLKNAFLQEAYTTDSAALNAAQEILAKRHDPAAALNEFMAWSLANRDLGAFLNRTTGPLAKIQRLAELAYRTIKKLIWGRKQAPKHADDVLAQIRFNTAIVVRSQPNIEGLIREGTLLHSSLAGVETTRLSQLREAFARKIARHLSQRYTPEWAKLMPEQPELSKPMQIATELTVEADAFFGMDGEEAHTFQMIVTALATEAEINPHSMVKAQELYTDFINGLHPSDFETGAGTQADEHAAIQKHDFIMGSTLKKWDVKGRSSILPVFLALALTNEQFRSVLAKKGLSKTKAQEIEGLDTAVENVGQAALDSLSDTLAGSKKPTSVLQAIDQLGTAVVKSALDEQAFLEKRFEYVNGLGRGLNAKMVALLRKIGAASMAKGDELRESNSKLAKGLGTALEGIAALTSEREGAVVAERAIEALDKNEKIWEPLREFTGDLVGRTGSAAKVWDMVKRVRSFVSQARQKYREKVPLVIKSKFTRKLTVDELDMQHRVMGRFDMASLTDTMTTQAVLELVMDREALKARIADGVSRIQNALPLSQSNLINEKIDQYVKFVQEGIDGPGLLTNANAIAALLTEKPQKDWVEVNKDTVREIDQLITLKLLDGMSDADRNLFSSLVQDEAEGMIFTLDYLKGQRKTELEKVQEGPAFYNHYKGHLPTETNQRGKLVVELDADHVRLRSLGYVRVAPYKGSSLETGGPTKSYYYAPSGGTKTPFQQGIAQNVQQTAYGIHLETGLSLDQTAGAIRDPVLVNKLVKRMHLEKAGTENLRPIFSPSGKVIAFERLMAPEQLARVQQKQDLPKMIGHWRGRQVEEIWAQKVNSRLVDYLHELWQKDRREGNENRYVNLLDEDLDDPVLRDAVALMPRQMRTLIRSKFGKGQFYVRRSMVNYVVGYRNASVGDFWTGNTRYSEQTQETIKKAMIAILGIEAYRKLVNVEKNWQAAMFSARTNIVVRSVVVPAANIIAGVYQLMGRGVSLLDIARGAPKKVVEIEYYVKSLNRQVELEAELRANESNVHLTQELKTELQTLKDAQRRLSIWPLLEAGEFSTISDVGQTADDLGITSGNIMEAMAKKVDELPPLLRDALRQGYMARDTAIFRTLQKSVQYGDFVMKAIYYDHMLKNEKEGLRQSMEYPQHAKRLGMQKAMEAVALGRITEEFNNYDVPTGRARGYLESIGMAWFLNYKIRATKIAVRMIRDNPLQTLLMMAMPHPLSVGTPVTDNLFAKLFDGTLGFSLTPSMALQPIAWNSWYNMVD